MQTFLLFPSDYFDNKQVDKAFAEEYEAASKIPEFQIILYNYDMFVGEGKLRFFPALEPSTEKTVCLARSWMLKPDQYKVLYQELALKGIELINNPEEYETTHVFINAYKYIAGHTPKSLFYGDAANIPAEEINKAFQRFMIKDYVKSAKGYDFPSSIDTPIDQDALDGLVEQFLSIRAHLYTGGIAVKEYVELKKYGGHTNEYRAFYMNGQLLSLSRNSSQPDDCPTVSEEYVNTFRTIPSHYYTIDFAELATGAFAVLETGDGQVSGLSPNQCILQYYDDLNRLVGGISQQNN